MGMVVRTNTMSANAYRQLGTNNTQLSKSLEKLSSGYRINRAGDDSSGLAISEKMKAQIAGLDQASANSQDGISLVQTAEGALTEVHSMLNRMVTLAEKSANGTIQDDVDRDAIQTETDALKSEITRVSQSTNFNGINLLDGSLHTVATATMSNQTANGTTGVDSTLDFGTKTGTDVSGSVVSINGQNYQFVTTAGTATSGNNEVVVNATDDSTALATALVTAAKDKDSTLVDTAAKGKSVIASTAGKITITSDVASGTKAVAVNGGGLTLQVGDTNKDYNKVTVSVENMSAAGLGIDDLKVDTQETAGNAIDTIKAAINTVSENRGNLGALQNRLEHAISNLDTTSENMSSANSAIRDTDMAKEMTNYTKMNILSQAAQAMLSQANQQPQNILQLLK